uniref:Uncharacterized protein n=1 Tax=Setaria italica TaxID=4555 RepID=K3YNV6_SETIT
MIKVRVSAFPKAASRKSSIGWPRKRLLEKRRMPVGNLAFS